MAGNPPWNTGLKEWKEKVNSWVTESTPQAVLDTSIFFDFKFIDGDPKLVKSLREHVQSSIDRRGVLFYHMAHAVQKMKIPSPNTPFDVKQWLLPIQAFTRIHSLQEGLSHTSTHERAEALLRSGKIDQSTYEELTGHLDFLSHLRIRHQLRSILQHEKPGNVLSPEQLTGSETHLLKLIHRQVQDLQSLLSAGFNLHQA
jgi:CBS domain-containing protein